MRGWLWFAMVIFSIMFVAGCVESGEKAATSSQVEIPIGVLVDLSGPLTTYGQDIKTTTTVAAEDINKKFEEEGKPYRVKLYIEDTKADSNIALSTVMALQAKDIKLIVGPMTSGEVKNVNEYVRSNKIIIASPSSTAETKYIGVTTPEEKKYLCRFVATDSFQTKSIAKLAKELGVKAVVITYTGNAWGKGLEEFGREEFQKQGIEIKDSVEYPDPAPADFSPYIAALEEDIDALMENSDKNEIAVVSFSYEEVATMLAQTKSDSSLLNVRWIGCDGVTKSSKVISDVPEKANKIKLYSTVSETKGGAELEALNKTCNQLTGNSPQSYGMNAYDATWVLALSYAQAYDELDKFDEDAVAEAIPKVAENYSAGTYGVYPVSGEVKLNEYMDRIGSEYRIYAVSDGSWKEVGAWKFATDKITWN